MIACLRCLSGCAAAALFGSTFAANLHIGVPSPLAEPVCITDPAESFVVDNGAPPGRYALVVRHMDADAMAAQPAYDFGALGDVPLTGFHPATPRAYWQRAKTDAGPDHTSAFQLQCGDAGFFINTWRFAPRSLTDEGPHAAYGYRFSPWLPVFDGSPDTDLALQVSMQVPWLFRPAGNAVAQSYFQVRFLDTTSGRFLQLVLLIFSSRGVAYPAYADHARNDSVFVSAPLATTTVATLSPYSHPATAQTWSGLRFFRAQITPANFSAALDMANRYCAAHAEIAECGAGAGGEPAFSADPTAYLITEFSVITEIFGADTGVNGMSMGLHLQGLGAYNFR